MAGLRQLIRLMSGSDIEELALEREPDGLKLTLRKPAPASTSDIAAEGEFDAYEPPEPSTTSSDSQQLHVVEIAAPLVGIFRASMQPAGAPLVAGGGVVGAGAVEGGNEALQVLKEGEASGRRGEREILSS